MVDARSESGPATPTHDRPAKRRPRWILVGAIVVLLPIVAIVALPWWLSPEFVRSQVVSALTNDLGLPVEIGGLDYHPLSGVALDDVRVPPPEGYARAPLRVGRVAVRYNLWSLVTGGLTVDDVALEDAHFVLETRNGRTNLDVLIDDIERALGPGDDDDETPDAPPSSITPIAVRVGSIAIGPLTIETAGEGLQAKLSDIWLRGQGVLGTRTLTASVALSVEPEAGRRNLTFESSGRDGVTTATAAARLRLPIDLNADSSAGFRLGATRVGLRGGLYGVIDRPDGPLPPIDLSAQLSVDARPDEGTVRIPTMRMALDGRTLLDANASASGLPALISQLVADSDGLLRVLGLRAEGEQPALRIGGDHIEAEVGVLFVPLSELAPVAAALLPGFVSAQGEVDARNLRVAGGIGQLLGGRPPILTGAIQTDRVAIDWPGVIQVRQLTGGLTAGRDGTDGYAADGRFSLEGLAVAGQRLEKGDLTVAAGVDQIDVATGATTATVTLVVEALATPPLFAKTAMAQVFLRGDDPLLSDRRAKSPVALNAKVRGSRIRIEGAQLAIARADVDAAIRADRVLDAAERPWSVSVDADVEGFDLPSFRTDRGTLSVAGTLDDVREAGFSTQLAVQGRFRKAATVGVTADRLSLVGKIGVTDIRRRRAPGLASDIVLPAAVSVELDARARRAGIRGVESPVALRLDGALDFDRGRLRVDRGRLHLGPRNRLSVSGRIRRLFQPGLAGRVRAALDFDDLEGAWAKIPVDLRGPAADLAAAGALSARLDLRGRWPSPWPARIDWRRPPARGRVTIIAREATVHSDDLGFDLRALTATVAAQVGPGVAVAAPRGRAAGLELGSAMSARGLQIDGTIGLEDGVWRTLAEVRADEASTVVDGVRLSDTASADFDARYVPRGNFSIDRFDARLPSVGVTARARGVLRRQPNGEFTPQLDLDGRVDVERLAGLVPALRPGRGQVGLRLRTQPDRSKTLKATGQATLEGLTWSTPTWTVERATGAIPVDQTLYLPPDPEPADDGGAGLIGDDFERRLAALLRRLQAVRIVVDPNTDILAAAPRTADHYALGPYRRAGDAEVIADRLLIGDTPMDTLRAEARLQQGVLRVDRFQSRMWEGDLLFDMAVQVTPQLDLQTRVRGTMTDLNLDIPYAKAKGVPRVEDPREQAEYLASGVMDFEFGLNQRALDGQIDVVRLSKPLVERLFGAFDPSGQSSAAEALGYSEIAAVRPVAAKIWVAQNLLNVQFEWERVLGFDDPAPWWVALDTVLFAPRIVSAWVLGGAWVIPTVNNSVKRASVFNFLDPYFGATFNDTSALLARFRTRIVSAADLPGLAEAPTE